MKALDARDFTSDLYEFFNQIPKRTFELERNDLVKILDNMIFLLDHCTDNFEILNISSELVKGGYKNKIGLLNAVEISIKEIREVPQISYRCAAEILDLYRIFLSRKECESLPETKISEIIASFSKFGLEREMVRLQLDNG